MGLIRPQRPIFGSYPYPPNFLFKNVHEYVLIFAKPPKTAVRGPKVQNYCNLMGIDPVPADNVDVTGARRGDGRASRKGEARMKVELCVQDPTNPATVYLFEAVIQAMDGASDGHGIFAFASRDGVNSLLLDEAVTEFLGRASFDLLVGIDAVTNRPTLERLQELQGEYPNLSVRVFWNRTKGLFHPKIARFSRDDGSQTVIFGSGNLTPGGLRDNFEAYSVLRTRQERHSTSPRGMISCCAMHRTSSLSTLKHGAGRKEYHPGRSRQGGTSSPTLPRRKRKRPKVKRLRPRSLIGCWLHDCRERAAITDDGPQAFNKDIIDQFFRTQPDSTQRVYLTAHRQDGSLFPQEVRSVIYSQRNKNLKIELGNRKGEASPTTTRLSLSFEKLGSDISVYDFNARRSRIPPDVSTF